MITSRNSGILLHPTSLPSPFGVGDLGPTSYAFADFLVSSGQRLWQVLPLGPTGYGNSPYSPYSAFAGNTLLISPEQLIDDGLLEQSDVEDMPDFPKERVDFDAVRLFKEPLLRKAFENFNLKKDLRLQSELAAFSASNAVWLGDYALFRALKEAHEESGWADWETELAHRNPEAIARERNRLEDAINSQQFYQFIFFRQWFALKSHCDERGIKIIGDLPIFVAYDSADVWSSPDQFKLDSELRPTVVAGVPPDYFSETGQLWGNPLYDWPRMEAQRYSWWIRRMEATLRLFDFVRMDHFRGFVAAWEIPAAQKTAECGAWVAGPGKKLFCEFENVMGRLPLIAEDLGVITPDVDALRNEFEFPGMRVLQFGLDGDRENLHLPHNYPENTVAYTGTHDNNTTVGWFNEEGDEKDAETVKLERKFCLEYLKSDGKEIHWDFINAVLGSAANTAVVPLQDVLGLGREARMNLPNSNEGNWEWRFGKEVLTEELVGRLKDLSVLHRRVLLPVAHK